MQKVLRSINSYSNFLGEDFKIILKLDVTPLDNTKVLATLKPYSEVSFNGQTVTNFVPSYKTLNKEVTKEEIKQFKESLALDSSLDMYEIVEIVELETAKFFIEQDELFQINGTFLLAEDFEIITLNYELY